MEHVQMGDYEAYRMLLKDVVADLRAYLRRHSGRSQEIEDLLQEVLLTMHRARHTYDPRRPFEPWLYAIARNTTVDSFRRNRRRLQWEQLAEDETSHEVAGADGPQEASLDRALAELPTTQREAVQMVKLQGLTIKEAAARAGVSEGAMRVRIHRGYRALRALLLGEDA